jgi:hypothetical protein
MNTAILKFRVSTLQCVICHKPQPEIKSISCSSILPTTSLELKPGSPELSFVPRHAYSLTDVVVGEE